MDINKAFLKRLQELDNKELLEKAYAFKVMAKVYSNTKFMRNYNTIVQELERRGLVAK
jgi:hypothetical protein